MSEDEAAFLRCICLYPDDPAPRLVYADYLDENGQPDRAEFIRRSIQTPIRTLSLDNLNHRISAREMGFSKKLLPIPCGSFGYKGWSFPFSRCFPSLTGLSRVDVMVRRGFIDEIHCTLAEFMAHAQEIAMTHPVRKWVLTDVMPSQFRSGRFVWLHEDVPSAVDDMRQWAIPSQLFEMLEGWIKKNENGYRTRKYSSRDAAISEIQQACYHYARIPLLASIVEGGLVNGN